MAPQGAPLATQAEPPAQPPQPAAPKLPPIATEEASAELAPVMEQAGQLAQDDRLDEADRLIVDSLPRVQWTPARYLVLGNVFFRSRPDLAGEFHKAAYDARPDDAQANLEWAIDLHRAGDCARAVPLYEHAVAAGPIGVTWNALLAECYLKAGKLEAATRAWFAAKQNERAENVERAIGDVHGPDLALRRRWALRQRIAQGEVARAADLVMLDAAWDGEGDVNIEKLDADVLWLGALPGIEPARKADLELFARTVREGECCDKSARKRELSAVLLGRGGRLPVDTRIAARLASSLVDADPKQRAALRTRWAQELRSRSEQHADADAMRLLILLNSESPGDMLDAAAHHKTVTHPTALWLEAWQRHADLESAQEYLQNEAEAGRLSFDSPDLQRALVQFPDDPRIAMLALGAAGEGHARVRELTVKAILTNFEHLNPRPYSSGVLQVLFAALHKQVFGSEPEMDITPGLDIQRVAVAPGELHALIETHASFKPLIGKGSKIKDLVGYYVRVSLTAEPGDASRIQVVGPLWSFPDPQSDVGYHAQVNFTQADVDAKRAHPYWTFDPDASLVRETPLAAGGIQRHRLEIHGASAAWADIGTRAWLPKTDRFQEDSLRSPSGRYEVFAEPSVKLYDTTTGKPQADAWLEQVYADLHRRMGIDLGNSHTFLSEDLADLVACPYEIWNHAVAPGSNQRTVTSEFEVEARKYKRGTYGLRYHRPSLAPQVFARMPVASIGPAEKRMVVVGGEPLLLIIDETKLRLIGLDGTERHSVDAQGTGLVEFGSVSVDDLIPDAGGQAWLFAASPLVRDGDSMRSDLVVVRWDLRAHKLFETRVKQDELFRETPKAFVPMHALALAP